MRTIILAAGNGQRFVDAGYTTSKPLLPLPDGRPMLAHVRESLPPAQQLLIARTRDAAALAPWIQGMGAVWIDGEPQGPLACLEPAAPQIDPHDELLISYCDSWLAEGTAHFLAAARQRAATSAIVIYPSSDPRYGYWDGQRIVEKQVVSPWAVAGLYYFRRGATFLVRLRQPYAPGAGVPALIRGDAYCYPVDDPIDLGTPADYEAFLALEHVP